MQNYIKMVLNVYTILLCCLTGERSEPKHDIFQSILFIVFYEIVYIISYQYKYHKYRLPSMALFYQLSVKKCPKYRLSVII